ncbi:flagellar protein FlaG [Rhodoferax sp. PAMC 29310]|uniref:flagellar protein FlaG n=1 Tax=Rhodoferax sp. PAMC 29310 TaxID=2822760 RepID=UPI001B331EFB|nr:flagellar protein FlaG [Rhodoferax sp. PAMC 29310]
MKGTAMIIQNTPQFNQAVPPDTRTHGAATARAEFKAAAAPPVQSAPPQVSPEELRSAVAVINQAMRQSNHSLEFSVDTDTHQTVVRMLDTSTGELIRQFPSEETLAISRSIGQFQQGLLLTLKA